MIILVFLVRMALQLINIYQLILVAYALMSWFPNARGTQLWNAISNLSRPYLEIFDRLIPSIGGVSFNVMIGIFVLQLIRNGIVSIIQILL